MQLEETFDFGCAVETVMAMFTNESYYHDKYRRLGSPGPEFLDCQSTDEEFSIRMRHVLDTSDLSLPDFARKRVGGQMDLFETDRWNVAARRGRIEIRPNSSLMSIDIDARVNERDSGSRLILNFDIRADVPLFGKKIEQAVAGVITRRMRNELEETARMAPDYM